MPIKITKVAFKPKVGKVEKKWIAEAKKNNLSKSLKMHKKKY